MPIQKSLKIDPSISSTSTLPIIEPRCLDAILKSSAASSISLSCFFSKKLFNSSKHKFNLFLCLSLVTKILSFLINLSFNCFFIKLTNLSIFLFSLTDIKTTSLFLNSFLMFEDKSDLLKTIIEFYLIFFSIKESILSEVISNNIKLRSESSIFFIAKPTPSFSTLFSVSLIPAVSAKITGYPSIFK